jgi:hypothetical protein
MGILTNGLAAIGAASRKSYGGGASASKPGVSGSSRWGPLTSRSSSPAERMHDGALGLPNGGTWCFDSMWQRASLRA